MHPSAHLPLLVGCRPPRSRRSVSLLLVAFVVGSVFGAAAVHAAARPEAPAPIETRGRAVLADLTLLASSDFAGRYPGTAGNERAAEFLVRRLTDLGYRPIDESGSPVLLFQQPTLRRGVTPSLVVYRDETEPGAMRGLGMPITGVYGRDFTPVIQDGIRVVGTIDAPLSIIGRPGSAPTDAAATGSDPTGGAPTGTAPAATAQTHEEATDDYAAWIRARQGEAIAVAAGTFERIVADAEIAGALFSPIFGPSVILIILPSEAGNPPLPLQLSGNAFPNRAPMVVQVTESFASRLATGDRIALTMGTEVAHAPTPTVAMAIGPTTDDPPLVLTAHFDGPGGYPDSPYFPGAIDNASGVAVVLELARVLADYRVDREVWVVFFNGEEQGLYGSQGFVDRYSSRLRGASVVNVDMVGHSRDIPMHVTYGSPGEWLAASVATALTGEGLIAEQAAGGGSDHVSFTGIASAVSVVQSPYRAMHRISDTSSNADAAALEAITRALAGVAFDLADASEGSP